MGADSQKRLEVERRALDDYRKGSFGDINQNYSARPLLTRGGALRLSENCAFWMFFFSFFQL